MGNFLKNIHPLLRRRKNKESDSHYAILDSINYALDNAEKDTIESKKQSSLNTATSHYLDTYGTWFGVHRRDGESDASYRKRIVDYVDTPRGTIRSIKLAIRKYLGDPHVGIEIYEPFRNIFRTNYSKLNGEDGLMGDYYRFAVIDISIGSPFDDDLHEYLERFVPSGVKVHVNYDSSLPRQNDTLETVSLSLFSMITGPSQLHSETFTGLEKYIGGRIQLSDTDEALRPFVTNHSKFNSEDVLTGSFTQSREHYHIIGNGFSIRPEYNDRMGDLLSVVDDLDKEMYNYPTEKSNASKSLELTLDAHEESCMFWNIDQYLYSKYYGSEHKLKRTREEYGSILDNSQFTITTRSENRGSTFDFQIFNFRTNRWENLHREVNTGSFETVHSELINSVDYLNNNRLMATRIKPNGPMELEVNYLALDYRKETT